MLFEILETQFYFLKPINKLDIIKNDKNIYKIINLLFIMTLTNNKFGYIYIRKNNWYNMFNICKLGKTVNIPDRDSTYITSEIERGHFYPIYSVDINLMDQIEKELQHEFIDYHFYKGGGKELYSIQIINLIELFLI